MDLNSNSCMLNWTLNILIFTTKNDVMQPATKAHPIFYCRVKTFADEDDPLAFAHKALKFS